AALDDHGVPSFQRLQERMHVADPRTAARKAGEVPASYLVFDILHLDGEDLMPKPWHERRPVLDSLGLAGPSSAATASIVAHGTGFTEAELDRLAARLGPTRRDTSPFTGGGVPKKASVFVEPELVVEVEYTERTDEGILRHPSYKGVRIDKAPADVKTVDN